MSIYIALGGNLPYEGRPPEVTLSASLDALAARDVRISARSRWWRSPAWPDPAAPDYVNGAARVETKLHAGALLDVLLDVEAAFGRVRSGRWGARTLDLDLIDYQGCVLDTPALILPHPRAHHRAFVLAPLRELAPDWRHPVTGEGIDALLAGLGEAEREAVRPLTD